MYCGRWSHATCRHARAALVEVVGIASAQDQSHPDAGVRSTGAEAYPFFPLTGLLEASSCPAPTVASYHIAPLRFRYCGGHSLKRGRAAPGSPASLTKST